MKKKSRGSLVDFVAVLLTIMAMLVILAAFFQVSELLVARMEVSQVTRRYVLRMETKGFLGEEEKRMLEEELTELGLGDIDLSGSTFTPVAYGETIVLRVRGKLGGRSMVDDEVWPLEWVERDYEVEEKRMSTAKN